MKKILCMIMAMAMVFCFSFTAFADGMDTAPILGEGVVRVDTPTPSTRGLSGYASKFVSSSGSGSFTVTVTGSYSWKAGITFQTSCDESAAPYVVVSIQRPNGGYIFQNLAFDANDQGLFDFYLAFPGTYTIYYNAFVTSGATVHMQCWIY